MYKDRITPNWFQNNTRFWYRNDLKGDDREFVLVDAEQGIREPAFDHQKLADALSSATGTTYTANHLPFDAIEFTDAGTSVRFKVGDAIWQCDLSSYQCSKDANAKPDSIKVAQPTFDRPPRGSNFEELTPETNADGTNLAYDPPFDHESQSPDHKMTALVKDYNLFIRQSDGSEVPLTQDGKPKASTESHRGLPIPKQSSRSESCRARRKRYLLSRIVAGRRRSRENCANGYIRCPETLTRPTSYGYSMSHAIKRQRSSPIQSISMAPRSFAGKTTTVIFFITKRTAAISGFAFTTSTPNRDPPARFTTNKPKRSSTQLMIRSSTTRKATPK